MVVKRSLHTLEPASKWGDSAIKWRRQRIREPMTDTTRLRGWLNSQVVRFIRQSKAQDENPGVILKHNTEM